MLNTFKQKINIKFVVTVYLIILIIYASFPINFPLHGLNGVFIILLYMLFDVLWTYIRDRVWYLPVAAVISGCVLGIVSKPDLPLIWVVLLPLLAVMSKQLIDLGKTRHIFNPAAFAMAIAGLFSKGVTWWGTSWSTIPLAIAAIVGIIILWKLNRFQEVIAFLISYTLFLSIYLLLTGLPVGNLLSTLHAYLINGTVLFFATIMLIDPITATFPTKKNQITFAVMVGFYAILATAIIKLTSFNTLDPLILGLLFGSFTASMLYLPNKKKKKKHATA